MGKFCDLKSDQCLKRPCSHGKCLLLEGGHACVCDLGFTGQFCDEEINECCLLYTSPSPRDKRQSRMPSSA